MSCHTATDKCHADSSSETSCCDSSCCESQVSCSSESSSPIDHVAGMWKDAFCHAMKQAQVEAAEWFPNLRVCLPTHRLRYRWTAPGEAMRLVLHYRI